MSHPPASGIPLSRRDFLRWQAALAATAALPALPLLTGCSAVGATPRAAPAMGPGREAFRAVYDGLATEMRALHARCKVTVDGHHLLRPCANTGYNGLWHDDFTWPHIGLPELQRGPEMAEGIAWLSKAMLKHPVVCDRVEYDGRVVMSPGSPDHPMSEAMPLHLPAAWTRLLSHAHAAGVTIPQKQAWAQLIALSFAQVPMSDGLVWCDPKRHIVSFGFQDSIRLTEHVLITSLVIKRGLERAADLFAEDLPAETIQLWRGQAAAIGASLGRLFVAKTGGFIGATGSGRAFDVWGNGLAYHLATDEQQKTIAATFQNNRQGIFLKGCTRQVIGPGGWPGTGGAIRYQNGGYWGTGTGFVLPMLAQTDPDFALALAKELLASLDGFKRSEWLDQQGGPGGVTDFLGTLSMPMIGLRAILEGRQVLDYL